MCDPYGAIGLHMGPIWAAPCMYIGQPRWAHMEPGCTPNLGPMLAAHIGAYMVPTWAAILLSMGYIRAAL
ncbi:hypothetical protein DPMN_013229 [Dreissena polymorpha]|uniref:Uncharacterized protein n=1 Tax=Dreissena polymorpha TaxID=45954 RepID=A0A9D4N8J4_DREPO|nr:hypothetical protein DPMN_013229 [Dreissena polymorpha]